jgi:hypothetical protein
MTMTYPILVPEDGPEIDIPIAELLGEDHPPQHRKSLRATLRDVANRGARRVTRAGSKARAVRLPDRFTVYQLAGGAAAGTGVFFEWGLAVGLMTVGLSVLFGSITVEILGGR